MTRHPVATTIDIIFGLAFVALLVWLAVMPL